MHEDIDDPDAFDTSFSASFPTVVRAVSFVAGDRKVAEKIAPDAFVQLQRHWGEVSGYERSDLWVLRGPADGRDRQHRRLLRIDRMEPVAQRSETPGAVA